MSEAFDCTLNGPDEAMSADALKTALNEYDAVCTTVTDKVGADILAAPGRAKVLGQFGVGFNNIDIEAVKAAGLTVTN
ncbi:MAG: D-glycerate dehydrogenase, partial [Pseudomonadota bacterium]